MIEFYKDRVYFNENVSHGIGIITGWSHYTTSIMPMLSDEHLKRVSSCGQLYSDKGIEFIIRNCYINPGITHLLLWGDDSRHTLKLLYDFLKSDTDEIPFPYDEMIPKEAIFRFREYFKDHVTAPILDSYRVDASNEMFFQKIVEGIVIEEKDWTTIQRFDVTEAAPLELLPSEKMGFHVRASSVLSLWKRALKLIYYYGFSKGSDYDELGQRELVHLTLTLFGEDVNQPKFLEELHLSKQELDEYYQMMVTSDIPDGLSYTYGSRLTSYQGINQLDYLISKLKQTPYSRRAVATIWNPQMDEFCDETPCFNYLQAILQDKLYMIAYFRSNDVYKAVPKNLFGILKIQDEIARKLGVLKGPISLIEGSAHIYNGDMVEVEKMLSQNPITYCEVDPRGYFVIQVIDDEIVVKEMTPNGSDVIQMVKGKSANELRDVVCFGVSNQEHAFYLGSELAKAEYALKNDIPYIQDEELMGFQKVKKR